MGITSLKAGSSYRSHSIAIDEYYEAALANNTFLNSGYVTDYNGGGGILSHLEQYVATDNHSDMYIAWNIDGEGEDSWTGTVSTLVSYGSGNAIAILNPSAEFRNSLTVRIKHTQGGAQNCGGVCIYSHSSEEAERIIIPSGGSLPKRSYTTNKDVLCVFYKSGGTRLVYPKEQFIDIHKDFKVFDYNFNTQIKGPLYDLSQSTFSGTKQIVIDGVYYDIGVNSGVIELSSIPYHITNDAFWDRFTTAEQETLITHSNAKVQALLYEIRIRPKINLRWQKLITAMNALETAGIIGAGRADEILAV